MQGQARTRLMIVAFAWAGMSSPIFGGGPDLANPVVVDADIRHVDGCIIITTTDNSFEDGEAAGYWAGIRMGDDVPVTYFQIVDNQHFDQGTITVFTFAQDMEGGNSKWWYYTECQHFDIFPPLPPPPPLKIEETAMVSNGVFKIVVSGAAGQDCTLLVSTNLVDWESLPTIVLDDGVLQFNDSAINTSPFRAYRIRTGD